MGIARSVGTSVGKSVAPHVSRLAPDLTANFVHVALMRAIRGIGKLPPAAVAAERQLLQHGSVDKAIHELIENHVRYAGLQGFLTNIGGLVTMAVTVPTNITGLALIQCRMVAGIVHLRGYDLADQRTRNAILACLLGEERVLALVKSRTLPGSPMELASALVNDGSLDQVLANEVAQELIGRAAGKRLVTAVGRRVPVVGGVVGARTDA
ncbi:MAG: EcsC family protein, partial [Nocardioidaceae bacterium]